MSCKENTSPSDSYIDKEYDIECPSGNYKLKPVKVWVVYSYIAGQKKCATVLALFNCPDGYHVVKKIDRFLL